MFLRICLVLLIGFPAFGQYDEYESYQTFTDLDKYQRDYGLVASLSGIYLAATDNNSVSGQSVASRSRNISMFDLKMGYVFRTGFYFGLLYAGDQQDVDSASPVTNRESIAVSFGYIRKGWSFMGHFVPFSNQRISGDSAVSEYSRGIGFQLDLSYYFRLGSYVSVGPQLVYKDIGYSEAEAITGNIDRPSSSKHTILAPMVTFLFNLYRG